MAPALFEVWFCLWYAESLQVVSMVLGVDILCPQLSLSKTVALDIGLISKDFQLCIKKKSSL